MGGERSSGDGFDPMQAVARLCGEGRALVRDGERKLALASFLEAWDLLPEPKESWSASTLILSAVGDLLREGDGLGEALDALVRVRGRTALGRSE